MPNIQLTQSLAARRVLIGRASGWLNGGNPRASPFGNSIISGVNGRNVANEGIHCSGKYQLAPNYGVAGNTSAMMLARIADVVNCDSVFFMEGSNDVTQGVTVRTHLDNYRAIIDHFLARNPPVTPVIIASPPLSNAGTGTASAYTWGEQLLAEEYGLEYYDPWASLVEPSTGHWVSGASDDGIHPSASGSQTAIDNFIALLRGTATSTRWACRSSAADSSGYLISGGNGMFLAGTAPSPTGWSRVGSTPFDAELISAPTGYRGNFYQMTATGAGSNPYLRKRVTNAGSVNFQAGDIIRVSFVLSVENFASGNTVTPSLSGGGGVTGGPTGSGLMFNTGNMPLTRYVGDYQVAGTDTLDFNLTMANAGTGTVAKIGEFEMANLTKLRNR